jgi:hypothetical protein
MRRAVLVLLASLALALPAASGAFAGTAGGTRAAAEVSGDITLRVRVHHGAWRRSLSIKLVKLRLTSFTLCAIWNHQDADAFDCDAASRVALPAGTVLRLEQSPVARALKRADSPGWGMLGASPDGGLGAVLSNLVTGNRRGTFHYRVTLRDRSNNILVASNTLTVVWR